MKDEYSDRHQAIKMRLAGQSVEQIGRALNRSREWFHKWWNRYLELGPDGLFDLTRANHQVARRIPPELERMILTIRRRLEAHTQPGTRYRLIGASTILAELGTLHIRPLPCVRTVERVLQRNGITLPEYGSRRMDEVLAFLVECWQTLSRPVIVQFDNDRELAGWGKAARYLS